MIINNDNTISYCINLGSLGNCLTGKYFNCNSHLSAVINFKLGLFKYQSKSYLKANLPEALDIVHVDWKCKGCLC